MTHKPSQLPDLPGPFRVSVDYLELGSPLNAAFLLDMLPMDALKAASHKFHIEDILNRWYNSRIMATCTANGNPLWLLSQWDKFISIRLTTLEVAFDILGTSEQNAFRYQHHLVRLIRKACHHRCSLRVIENVGKPPKGLMAGPTIYFEDESSTVALKVYCRWDKRTYAPWDKPRGYRYSSQAIVRLEITLKGSAIIRYLGGNRIEDLLVADLNQILDEIVRFEVADHVELGTTVALPKAQRKRMERATDSPGRIQHPVAARYSDPAYLAKRRWCLLARRRAYREIDAARQGKGRLGTDWDLAYAICRDSPAEIRGSLRELPVSKMQGQQEQDAAITSYGTPPISAYKVGKCFKPMGIGKQGQL